MLLLRTEVRANLLLEDIANVGAMMAFVKTGVVRNFTAGAGLLADRAYLFPDRLKKFAVCSRREISLEGGGNARVQKALKSDESADLRKFPVDSRQSGKSGVESSSQLTSFSAISR